ncbi:YhcN/YlaJ family sporulation lipoprotein [Caldalkalibacillus salinus]|uniref:YhcN/YlaJ family sporulation lipoprotein n=1 Tax=Caldalkalibacillus salinus TaxID=2803787 RepID=UPI001922C501|nr:YhcN/YlaJ family sporulation lipoprotein [Caldalkalibacillus salinus]
MKKTALGLTLALVMGATVACTPGDQGAADDQRLRSAGQYQERTHQNDNRSIGTNDIRDRQGLMGRDQNYTDPRYRGLAGRIGDEDRGTDNRRNMGNGVRGGAFLGGGKGTRMQDASRLNRGNMRFGNENTEMARDLEQRILSVPGVEDARVMVDGDDVVCGVETNGNRDEVMKRVEQEVQQDTRGQQVHITDDADIFGRLGNMGNQNQNQNQNGPIEDTGREMQRLLRDIGRSVGEGNQ